jgi:hypothetical protein
VQQHAARDAALDGGGLVERKVHARGRANQREDLRERVGRGARLFFGGMRGTHLDHVGMARNAGQLAGDLVGRKHEISRTGLRGAARHVGVARRSFILRERDAALGLDRRQTQRPVGPRAR